MKGLIIGGTGMVGSGLANELRCFYDQNVTTWGSHDVNLLSDTHTNVLFDVHKIDFLKSLDYVIYAAGYVSGIGGQKNNKMLTMNVAMFNSFLSKIVPYLREKTRVINLSSSCMYPTKNRNLTEYDLFNGEFEESNYGYGLAKAYIYGTTRTLNDTRSLGSDYRRFVTLVLPNMYSSVSENNFHPRSAHVAQAMIHRFKSAIRNKNEEVWIWGTGRAFREYMDVKDLAPVVNQFTDEKIFPYDLYNVGTGDGINIGTYAINVSQKLGYKGRIRFDPIKPEGSLYKCMDSSRIEIALGDYMLPEFNEDKMIDDLLEDYNNRVGKI